MFDLDTAISKWRREMVKGGVASPGVLNELESHLRDTIADLMCGGAGEQQAFSAAVQQLGGTAPLRREFQKVDSAKDIRQWARQTFLVFAGIPNGDNEMNAKIIEPRWATYLKAAAFLLPALVLWAMSVIFIYPKLQQICAEAGGQPLPGMLGAMVAVTRNALLLFAFVVALLGLLEWRVNAWPRYRRAAIGVGTFLVNGVVLTSIFLMVVSVMLVAPSLLHHAR